MDLELFVPEVVVFFSQTTEGRVKQWLADIPANPDGYYFVSAGLPTTHKIKIGTTTIEYQVLKQKEQYKFLKHKLSGYEFDSFSEGILLFEQTKIGNLHFHAVVKATGHFQNIKADFFSCFGLKRGQELKHSFRVDPVKDLNGLKDYLFNKDKKSYEKVCPVLFKPLIIQKDILTTGDNVLMRNRQFGEHHAQTCSHDVIMQE